MLCAFRDHCFYPSEPLFFLLFGNPFVDLVGENLWLSVCFGVTFRLLGPLGAIFAGTFQEA